VKLNVSSLFLIKIYTNNFSVKHCCSKYVYCRILSLNYVRIYIIVENTKSVFCEYDKFLY